MVFSRLLPRCRELCLFGITVNSQNTSKDIGVIRVAGKKTSKIRVGIGGWTFAPWRGTFYPDGLAPKRELEYASQKLTSIEINGTFYGSQKPESFRKWHDETP